MTREEIMSKEQYRLLSDNEDSLIDLLVKDNIIPIYTGVVREIDENTEIISKVSYHVQGIKNEESIPLTKRVAYILYYRIKLNLYDLSLSKEEKELLSLLK